MNTKVRKNSGFTLIELLIVIGLLGALTALVLPSMMADREAALGNICDYNQAGTLRVLKQYQQITHQLPNCMHSGLKATDADSATDAMDGIPKAQQDNLDQLGSYYKLTAGDVKALGNAGIVQLAYDTGLNLEDLAVDTVVLRCLDTWLDDGPASYTFDGRSVSDLETQGAKVMVFFIAPTTDWESGVGGNFDWGQGNVTVGLDLEGKCPIPAEGVNGTDPEFAYYMAYVAVYTTHADVVSAGGGAPVVPDDIYASAAAAMTALDDAVTASARDWVAGSVWTETASGIWNRTDNGVDCTDGTADDVTYTVTHHDDSDGTAKLVGTSCPECGVMNP